MFPRGLLGLVLRRTKPKRPRSQLVRTWSPEVNLPPGNMFPPRRQRARQALTKTEQEELRKSRRKLVPLVESTRFNMYIGIVIMCNALTLCLETDQTGRTSARERV